MSQTEGGFRKGGPAPPCTLESLAVPILGAHVDSSGGLHLAFERAAAMGAHAIQVHPTPPNYWGSPKLDDERVERFRQAAEAAGNPPFYFHAVYQIGRAHV